jgi:uncharacterized protein
MQYSEGQIGRIFVVRIDDGEDLLHTLRQFIQDKGIRAGSVIFLGALMEGKMVTGPEEPVIPPLPHYIFFEGGWEVFGVGTIYPGEDGPHLHYHASVGRAGHALTGCLREKAVTYLIVEAVIYEITGLSARHEFDEKTQIHLPTLKNREEATKGETESVKVEKQRPVVREEKTEDKSELPGGLADIIRDLTRRPPS